MTTKVKDHTVLDNLFTESIDASVNSLVKHTPAVQKNGSPMGALLAVGGLAALGALSSLLGNESSSDDSVLAAAVQKFRITPVDVQDIEHLPRLVSTDLSSSLEGAHYFSVQFMEEKPFILCVSKHKGDNVLHFHYPENELPNPIFEGSILSYQDVTDHLMKRLAVTSELEITRDEILEAVDTLSANLHDEIKDIMYAPISQMQLVNIPDSSILNLPEDATDTLGAMLICTSEYGALLCNDFLSMYKKDGKIYFQIGTNREQDSTYELLSGNKDTIIYEALVKRLSQEWKPRYRQSEEMAHTIAKDLTERLLMAVNAMTNSKPVEVPKTMTDVAVMHEHMPDGSVRLTNKNQTYSVGLAWDNHYKTWGTITINGRRIRVYSNSTPNSLTIDYNHVATIDQAIERLGLQKDNIFTPHIINYLISKMPALKELHQKEIVH